MPRDKIVSTEERIELKELLVAQTTLTNFLSGKSINTKFLGIFGKNNPFAVYEQLKDTLTTAEGLVSPISNRLRQRISYLRKTETLERRRRHLQGTKKEPPQLKQLSELLTSAYNNAVRQLSENGDIEGAISGLIKNVETAHSEAMILKNPMNPESVRILKEVSEVMPKLISTLRNLLKLGESD